MMLVLRLIVLVAALAVFPVVAAQADDFTGERSYYGTINAVAPGFYGHTGVEMTEGSTCKGRRQLILLTSNPRYNDILALLLTAQASKTSVTLCSIGKNVESNGYCTIGEASLGNFSLWWS